MLLRYTPAAKMDLTELQSYIAEVLKNPVAAKNVTNRIVRACSILKEQPFAGPELAAMTGRDTDLHYLVCGKHIAFYRVEDACISIVRILDGRTNYMQLLFGAKEEEKA